VVSDKGEPVEFSVAPASEADVKVFKELDLELPEGATIHADKGYTDYHYEDLLEEVGVKLLSQRKKRSKRPSANTSRDGLQQAECVIFEEDPCGYAKGL
jgi:IS5 family transposase